VADARERKELGVGWVLLKKESELAKRASTEKHQEVVEELCGRG